jgi:hypothetical protein
MQFRALALCALCWWRVAPVYAHGPQLQIDSVAGKIVTREILNDIYTPLTDPKTVYVMPVLDYRGVWYARPETAVHPPGHLLAGQPTYYSGAGLAYGVGQTFSIDSSFSLHFDAGLTRWNGSSFVDAGPTQLEAYRGGSIGLSGELINPSASAISSNLVPFAQLDFAPIAAGYDHEAHSTARLRFLGDGTTSVAGAGTTATEPADDIYLATFVVTSTQPGLAPSDPFHFVMHKNAQWGDVLAAVKSLGVAPDRVQLLGVAEPSTFALTGIAVAALSCAIRRSRKE